MKRNFNQSNVMKFLTTGLLTLALAALGQAQQPPAPPSPPVPVPPTPPAPGAEERCAARLKRHGAPRGEQAVYENLRVVGSAEWEEALLWEVR